MTARRLTASLFLVLIAACGAGRPSGVPAEYEVTEVPGAIAEASAELTAGDAERALWRMRIASETEGLAPEVRGNVQRVLESAAQQRITELSAPGSDPEELEELSELDLPRQIAVTAGIRAAGLLFAEGERVGAFRLVKKIDTRYPHHHERAAAGKLLSRVGFSLAEDPGKYGLFFRYRSLAPQVLEYLVLNYPSDPSGARAYWTLAEMYEEGRYFALAIEKHEDLTLWYTDSEYVPASKARIPHLRLTALGSPEYDREEMSTTRRELERWLAEYPGHELEGSVRTDLIDCIQRLTDSDLIIARFYRRVGSRPGAEYHARRAVQEATDGGNAGQIAEAEALLRDVLDAAAAGPGGTGGTR